jgi:energy-coupling factor transport system ATP-binding protein
MGIEFSRFTFKYKALQNPTLNGINLKINRGEKILVIGASGSGKSTLGHCLNGLAPEVISGEVGGSLHIEGVDTRSQDLHQRTQVVGTVLQDTDGQFVGLSVAEDIAFALENQCVAQSDMRATVQATAQMVDLESLLEQSPFELSGGQKQRVSLAGILVDDVDILLFDEPLASLDPKTGQRAIEIIDQLHRDTGKTVVIIEHRLEDVLHRPVDRVVLMDKGQIVADCPPDEILAGSLLNEYGIRSPLYTRALSLAGCTLQAGDHLADFEQLDLGPHRDKLLAWYRQQPPADARATEAGVLTLESVCYSYDGEKQILDGISFDMGRGEFLAILGKNGSGKSTLTKLLMGALAPDSGKLSFAGENLEGKSIFERSAKIGVVMQNPNHMISQHMIFDEVALGLRNRGISEQQVEGSVSRVLDLCGLRRYAHWPVDALSYGQKKRVTIASLLVLEPELLILDEPTAGQDLHHYTMMMQFIRELNEQHGISILIISHDLHLVLEYCSRAIVLADGKLLADDSVYRIFSQPELLARANLVETSLFQLAQKLGIDDAENFIRCFVSSDAGEAR